MAPRIPPFRIDHHHYHHNDPGTHDALAQIIAGQVAAASVLTHINKELHQMSAELDRLTAEVAQTKDAADSAVALITGLAQQIRDNATDPAALSALADSLDASQAEIADAVTANTPAAPSEPTA